MQWLQGFSPGEPSKSVGTNAGIQSIDNKGDVRENRGMYIRRISRRLASGRKASYLQLAQKVRDPKTGAPRDQVLYHFGPEDQIDQNQIRRLVKSLNRFLDPGEQAATEATLDGLGTRDVAV